MDVFSLQDTLYLAIINRLTEKLEVYNISENRLITSIDYLNLTGDVDEFGRVLSFTIHNFDSIFFLQQYLLSMTNTVEVKWAKEINTGKGQYKDIFLYNLDHAPIYYDQYNNKISVQTYCYSCEDYKKSYYTSMIHASYSPEDDTYTELPVSHSKMYIDNYYGFHNHIFRREYDDRYVVSFSADPNIYIYNKLDKEIEVNGGRCSYQPTDVRILNRKYKADDNKKLRHFTIEPFYDTILYDEYRNLYYRFFYTGVEDKNPDGTYNTMGDKELILMLFDHDLKLITEINYGSSRYFPSLSFVGKEGLYLKVHQLHDSTLSQTKMYYDVLRIK